MIGFVLLHRVATLKDDFLDCEILSVNIVEGGSRFNAYVWIPFVSCVSISLLLSSSWLSIPKNLTAQCDHCFRVVFISFTASTSSSLIKSNNYPATTRLKIWFLLSVSYRFWKAASCQVKAAAYLSSSDEICFVVFARVFVLMCAILGRVVVGVVVGVVVII